jgi:hypothetical protein
MVSLYNDYTNDFQYITYVAAKRTKEKIEKNTATINYGIFTAKTKLDQVELVEAGK